MKSILSAVPDALILAGSASVSYGAWAIYPPAGWIVCGVFALAAGIVLARSAE